MAGKVSDSEDVGTANARADDASREQAYKDFGRNNTSVNGKTGTFSGEPKVSPLIYVTPKKGYSKGGRVVGVPHFHSKVIK